MSASHGIGSAPPSQSLIVEVPSYASRLGTGIGQAVSLPIDQPPSWDLKNASAKRPYGCVQVADLETLERARPQPPPGPPAEAAYPEWALNSTPPRPPREPAGDPGLMNLGTACAAGSCPTGSADASTVCDRRNSKAGQPSNQKIAAARSGLRFWSGCGTAVSSSSRRCSHNTDSSQEHQDEMDPTHQGGFIDA